MDDKLTKFHLPLSLFLSPSAHPPLFFYASLSLWHHVTALRHMFLEEDCNCRPPLSLLAAFGREPLYFMGFSNLLETLSALSLSLLLLEKGPIRGQGMWNREDRRTETGRKNWRKNKVFCRIVKMQNGVQDLSHLSAVSRFAEWCRYPPKNSHWCIWNTQWLNWVRTMTQL